MSYLQDVVKDLLSFKPATIILLASLLAIALLLYMVSRKVKWNARMLTYGALCITIGFVLSYIRFLRLPQAGSITLASMLPVMAFAYMAGPAAGLLAGVAYGLLQLIQDFYVVHPVQLMLDYILAFAAQGLAGFFRKNLVLGILVGGFVRFLCHFISGMVFFGSYAPAGTPVFLYSLGYNALVVGPDLAICLVVALIPQVQRLIKYLSKSFIPAKNASL